MEQTALVTASLAMVFGSQNQGSHDPSSAALLSGKYQVVGEIGRGGMGIVLKAQHLQLKKLVAIKVLNAVLLVDRASRARFELEAEAGAKLSHPNLVSVIDCGFTANNEPYLVMEYVEGIGLDKWIERNGPLTIDRCIEILMPIAKALRYLHDNGIVHRDLKASNIMLQIIGTEMYPRLLDLGIAKVVSNQNPAAQLTSTGMMLGSPPYMSPEQCQGQLTDARSDVYSFGCMIYECVSGRLPFQAENALQIFFKHLNEVPVPFACKVQRDAELWDVVRKCLEKNPANRFQSVAQLIDALQRVQSYPKNEKLRQQALKDSAQRSMPLPPSEVKPKSYTGAIATGAAGTVLLALLTGFFVTQQKPEHLADSMANVGLTQRPSTDKVNSQSTEMVNAQSADKISAQSTGDPADKESSLKSAVNKDFPATTLSEPQQREYASKETEKKKNAPNQFENEQSSGIRELTRAAAAKAAPATAQPPDTEKQKPKPKQIEQKATAIASATAPQYNGPGATLIGYVSGGGTSVYLSTKDKEAGTFLGSHTWYGEEGNARYITVKLKPKTRYYIHVVSQPPSDRVFLGYFGLEGNAKFAVNHLAALDTRPQYWRVTTRGFGNSYHSPGIAPGGDNYIRQVSAIQSRFPYTQTLIDPQVGAGYAGYVYYSTAIDTK